MDTIPLLSHSSPTAVVAYRGGTPVTALQFLADARSLALRLPESRHVLNVCADRYRFTVGLAACLISGRVSLLPSTHTPQVIAQLADFAPDAFCLTDDANCDIQLQQILYQDQFSAPAAAGAADFDVPRIPAAQPAAIVIGTRKRQ